MRQAANSKTRALARDAVFASMPAPVGGWNSRDSLTGMNANEAIELSNWFPRTTYCEIRGGGSNHVTGIPTLPKSLMAWNGPAGSNKMFASTDAAVYDTTAAGAVGASVATCTTGKWQWINYAAVSGVHYLIMVNGTDKPKYYNGTTWIDIDAVSVPALTGLTSTSIIHVNLYKHRLFFLEKNKLNFWYLPVQVAGGALTEFVLGSLARRGGFTMAMATWTIDAGEGVDDYAVFLTSEGEALVFRGTDPASSTDWTHEGTYFIGKPLGRNCFAKFGGDVAVITEAGLYPLSRALMSASIDRSKALSDKIIKSFNEAASLYGSTFGWQVTVYPAESALIVNIPVTEGGTHKQYVMNTVSQAWCEFSGWNAEAFLVFNGLLYYCSGTSVSKAWTGHSDVGGINITANGKTAFHYFGPEQKRVTMFRPLFMTNGSLNFNVGLNMDFEDGGPIDTAVYTVPPSALWDSAIWDVDIWAVDLLVIKDWRTPASKMGFRASGVVRVATNGLTVQWAATDYLMEKGDIL